MISGEQAQWPSSVSSSEPLNGHQAATWPSAPAGLSLPVLWSVTAQMLGAGEEVSGHCDGHLKLIAPASV